MKSSEELRSAERGDSPRPAAGQEGRHQGFYPLNSHFLLGGSGADCRPVTAAKRGTAVGLPQRGFRKIFAVHRQRTATHTVNSTQSAALLSPRGPSLALRAIHLVPRLRKLTHMCSRTISGTAYRFRHGSTLCSPTVEKILCRSLFSKRSHIGNLRQIRKQGKGRSSKRKGTHLIRARRGKKV